MHTLTAPSGRLISRRRFLGAMSAGMAAAALDWRILGALAATIEPKSAYPVVVIGAGVGGLTAAAYLAKSGFPVTVIEQHEVPGGYAVSFTRGGFTFEVSPHYVVALGPLLEDLGIRGSVELVDPPWGLHAVGRDFDLRLPKDAESAAQELAGRFPAQAQAIRAFLGEVGDFVREYRTPIADARAMPATHPVMTRFSSETAEQLLARHFTDPHLRAVFACYGYSFGMPPSELTAQGQALAVALGLLTGGRQFLRHRPLSLPGALARAVEEHGGRILLGTEVTGILTKDGTAVGIRTGDGSELPARAVVANASAPATFGRLLAPGTLPSGYLEKVRTYRPSTTTFNVWLGLRQSLKGRVEGHAHLVMPEAHDWEGGYRAVRSGDVSGHGFAVYVYDDLEPRHSPPGKSMVNIVMMCGYEPWRRFEADYLSSRKDAYRHEKDRVVDILIDRTERWAIPGLRSMIEVREAATPLTNLRYTKNPDGAILGYQCSIDNCGITRLKNRTPVRGLYLASAWGDPGGGINPVMRGAQGVFRALMEDWNT